jgi:hypothetical protein
LAEHAIKALGYISLANRSPDLIQQIIDGLFDLANIKHPEIHFAVGRSLAYVGSGSRTPDEMAEHKQATGSGILTNILETIIFKFMGKGSVLTRSLTEFDCVISLECSHNI